MKFYIASSLDNAQIVSRVANVLKAAGHIHTYDWTRHGNVQADGEERLREVGRAERAGVEMADIVIVIFPGGRGTNVELGIAVAKGKRIILCAESENDFLLEGRPCALYYLYGIDRITGLIDDWLTVILKITQY